MGICGGSNKDVKTKQKNQNQNLNQINNKNEKSENEYKMINLKICQNGEIT